jgi:GNAT superfamily N-acetyltransferase
LKTFIRKLKKKELQLFIELFKESTPKTLSKCVIYACFDKLKMVGGVVLNTKPETDIKAVAISYFYIIEEYRGLGLGKSLIRKVIQKYRSIILTTGPKTNAVAHHIYKSSGFQVTGSKQGVKYWSYIEKPIENITDFDFFCIPHSCKMLKSACIKRQKLARVPSSFQNSPAYTQGGCSTCKDAYVDITPIKKKYSKIEVIT